MQFCFIYYKTLLWHILNTHNTFFIILRNQCHFNRNSRANMWRRRSRWSAASLEDLAKRLVLQKSHRLPCRLHCEPSWCVCACVSSGSYRTLVRGPALLHYPSISLTSALSPRQAFELNVSRKALGQHKPPCFVTAATQISLPARSDLTLRPPGGPSQALTLSARIRGPCRDSNLSHFEINAWIQSIPH